MHKSKKLIALTAALAILFTAFAPVSAAQSPETETASVQRVGEVVSLRQTDSETYLLSDGTYECVVYAGDKYYKNEADALLLIDNTLIPVTAASSRAGSYKNTANAFDVYFSGSGKPEVTMQYGGSRITFSPINTSLGTSNRIDADDQVIAIGATDNCTVLNSLTPTGDNTITYSNAFASTDLVYVLENQMLKEYIILNSSNSPNTFRFMFTLEGLTLQTVGGTTCFVDENGTPVFSLASLYAVDSAGNYTEAVTYTCIPVKDTGNVIITVTLAEEYLSDPQRSYPVVIDPTVMISSIDTADAYVSSANPDTNYYVDTCLRTGFDSPFGIRRGYIKFQIPSSVSSDVTSASLDLERVSGATPTVTAYRSLTAWSSSAITWNNKPFYSNYHASTVSAPRSSGSSWYTMDVTGIVQDWQSGSFSNYGFVLVDSCENNYDHWTTFYSSDAPSPHKPELHISYTSFSPVNHNRYSTTYQMTARYKNEMTSKMNCYGYALHVYSLEGDADDANNYRQLPGEFAQNGQSYSVKREAMENRILLATSGEELLDYIENKVYADFSTLASIYGDKEWSIIPTSADASVPSGYQKIALAVGCGIGYHFYLRHSNAVWSHKPGLNAATNLSIDTCVEITDNNISSKVNEGYYSDGVRYYLIKKPAIIDYPHENGHGSSSTYTETKFSDRAGDFLQTGTKITGNSVKGRFDYSADLDNFYYTTPDAGTYTFLVAPKSAGTNITLLIGDVYGNIIASYNGTQVPVVTVSLASDMKYLIQIYDNNNTLAEYELTITY